MRKSVICEVLLRTPLHHLQGFFNGHEYLRAVAGEDGQFMQLVALGYTMAARDADLPAAPSSRPAGRRVADAGRTLQDEVDRVCGHLRARPDELRGPAASQIRRAMNTGPAVATSAWPAALRRVRPALVASRSPSLAAAFAAAVVLTGVLSLPVAWHGRPAPDAANRLAIGLQASRMLTLLLEERRYEKDAFISIPDDERVAAYTMKWADSGRQLIEAIAALESQPLDESDARDLEQIRRDWQRYVEGCGAVLAQVRAGTIRSTQEANSRVEAYKTFVHAIEARANAMAQKVAAAPPRRS